MEVLKADENWRIILLMPAFIAIVSSIILLVFIRDEPYGFCITEGRSKEAKRMLSRVFKRKSSGITDEEFEELIEKQYQVLGSVKRKDTSSTTLGQAMCGKQYRRATWTCFVLNMFN